jgi:DNA polymerase-1
LKQGPVFTSHKWLQLDDDVLGTYNAWDCYATAKLVPAIGKELRDNGQFWFFEERVWPLVDVVLGMQRRGLQLDTGAKTRYRRQLRRELRETEESILAADPTGELAKPTPKYPNGLNSWLRKGKFLFTTLGLKPTKLTDTGGESTDQESLVRILRGLRKKDEPYRPVIEALFHRSRLRTIDSRYLDLDVGEDGRVRPTIKVVGAETGRLAYADPPLQQYPKEARHIYRAPDGYNFISADYRQLEARILAHLSQDQGSLEVFEAGGDIHQQNACDLFGYDVDTYEGLDPAKRVAVRDFSKTFLYGLSYGGEAETMKTRLYCPCPKCVDKVAPTLDLKRAQIREAARRWFSLHQPVVRWRNQLTRTVTRGDNSYTNAFGRKRYFFTPWPTVEREILNFPMQSTAADLINRVMIQLHAEGAPMVLQMHDSLMLEVREEETEKWARRLKEVMETPVKEVGRVQFPVDLQVGPNWGSLREYPL